MTRIVFFDTETTGNEDKDYLCQLAYKEGGTAFEGLYKPPVPISFESMAVHHITEKMVADKPAFQESPEYADIKALFENSGTVSVAHNAKFDLAMLAKDGIVPARHICTLRVARHLDPNGVIPNYRLQFLRYYLGIEITATAHDALGDVLVLEQLFARLLKKVMDEKSCSEDEAVAYMEKVSNEPSIFQTMIFGKYKGFKMEEIRSTDPGYLEWMLNEKLKANTPDDEDWIHTLKHFLGKL